MTVAIALPTLSLSDDEQRLLDDLLRRLGAYQAENRIKADYYEAKQRLRDMGIAIPPSLRGMAECVGWPGTAVDVLEERLDLEGWSDPDLLGLDEVFANNDLDVEASLAHLDALIYGTAFAAVSAGFDGEDDPLITVESPLNMTGRFDLRSRRLSSAVSVRRDEDTGLPAVVTLYLPDATIYLECVGAWHVIDRDVHRLGRVPVAQLVNRPRSGAMGGRSEITPTVRSYTDNAMRTLIAAEVAREFHAAPQRYILGSPESFFLDENGEPKSAWESYIGRFLAIERDDADEVPVVGTFAQGSLDPYFAMIRTLSQLLAAEASIPASYLGFVTENPSSADAIRQAEARLVKRAERRQKMFGRAWSEVARLAVMVRDGRTDVQVNARPKWRDAATPTRAAAADEAVKLIGAGVLTPDSAVTYDRIGLSQLDQQILATEKRRAGVTTLLRRIPASGTPAQNVAGDVPASPANGATPSQVALA